MNVKLSGAIASTLLLMTARSHAQSPAPAAAPTPPAASPTAPVAKPCSSPAYRQFDFWIGDWDVTNPAGRPAGTNLIKPILNGCVLQESWGASGGGFTGQSHNTYDALRHVWHQTWVDSSGTLLLLEGRFDNGAMTLSDKDTPGKKDVKAINEIAWTPNADGSVRQLWRTSGDGGKTWTVAFDGKYVRSVRAQPAR